MIRYLIKRILLFVPTLGLISLLGFALLVSGPGDPVQDLLDQTVVLSGSPGSTKKRNAEAQRIRERLGLDLPVFYCSISSFASPDTLYRILPASRRETAERMIARSGCWPEIQEYFKQLHHFQLTLEDSLEQASRSDIAQQKNLQNALAISKRLDNTSQEEDIVALLNELPTDQLHAQFQGNKMRIFDALDAIRGNGSVWKTYIPAVHFYDNNQYHRWLFGDGVYSKGIIRGDFGYSYRSGQAVSEIISSRIGWSVLLTLTSVLLAFLISIPLGLRAAAKPGSFFDRGSATTLFLLYSVPSFWMAAVLLMTFSNPDVLAWFPVSGVKPVTGYPDDASFLERASITVPYLILPLICYTYGALAFLSRTLRASMLEILGMDFIRSARAKGLSENRVVNHHGFRNALLPLITVIASVFPAAVGGSVIIETIFAIPGLGNEVFLASRAHDLPVVVAVFCLTGFLTMLGILIADLLYTWADPRIRIAKSVSA